MYKKIRDNSKQNSWPKSEQVGEAILINCFIALLVNNTLWEESILYLLMQYQVHLAWHVSCMLVSKISNYDEGVVSSKIWFKFWSVSNAKQRQWCLFYVHWVVCFTLVWANMKPCQLAISLPNKNKTSNSFSTTVRVASLLLISPQKRAVWCCWLTFLDPACYIVTLFIAKI